MTVSKCMTFGIINHFLLENLLLMHSFVGSSELKYDLCTVTKGE